MMCEDCVAAPGGYTSTGFTGGRFQASPYFDAPMTPKKLSQQAPIFLPACTQFIVEYAGDFFNQDTNGPKAPNATDPVNPNGYPSPTYGQVLNTYWNPDPLVPSTDGQIDFVVTWDDRNNNGLIDSSDPIELASVKRKIRWYGLPRDVDGRGAIPGWSGGSPRPYTNDLNEVVPIGDVMFTAINTVATTTSSPPASGNLSGSFKTALTSPTPPAVIPSGMFFEHTSIARVADYASVSAGLPPGTNYTCAFGPTDAKPKMIRILMTIDDPNGKLPEGQTYEFVFTLP
jgi:hypothetical protein